VKKINIQTKGQTLATANAIFAGLFMFGVTVIVPYRKVDGGRAGRGYTSAL
jgi:hypothetical protein